MKNMEQNIKRKAGRDMCMCIIIYNNVYLKILSLTKYH